jgi:ferric-dicitrate binding protein FerR (iron transport regulator)
MNESERKFEEAAKRHFDESVESLDAATLSRLNRGRQAALEAARSPSRQWSGWMPLTGVAAAALVAVVTFQSQPPGGVIEAPASDFEILLSEESIDMFEELEFYSWLDTQELELEGDVG